MRHHLRAYPPVRGGYQRSGSLPTVGNGPLRWRESHAGQVSGSSRAGMLLPRPHVLPPCDATSAAWPRMTTRAAVRGLPLRPVTSGRTAPAVRGSRAGRLFRGVWNSEPWPRRRPGTQGPPRASTASAVSEIIWTAAHASPFCRATWATVAVSMSAHTPAGKAETSSSLTGPSAITWSPVRAAR